MQFEGYWIRQGMMGRKNGTGESGVVGGNGIRDMMWKEYAKSDSRYLTRDGGMWAGEVVTVVSSLFSRNVLGCGESVCSNSENSIVVRTTGP